MTHRETETFDIAGPAGRLEAILNLPPAEVQPRAGAVLCHAHPLHGGMMHFKVVFRAAKALQALGIPVLRFNFRGVGRSEGTHDHGVGEQADARAALDEVARRFPGIPLLIGGFSFGAAMAAHVAEKETAVKALILLGFPITRLTDLSYLSRIHAPRLFVQGGDDQFGSGAAIRQLVAGLPEPRQLDVVEGADHFFTGSLDQMQNFVSAWAARSPWEAA